MKNTSHYKEKLDQEKKVLIEELQGIGVVKDARNKDDWQAKPDDEGEERADPNNVADKIESYEGNNAIVQQLETRLQEVDAALRKIESNTFGICETCGAAIEEDRLEANPAAATCKAHM